MKIEIRPKINTKIFSWIIDRVALSQNEVIEKYPQFYEWQSGDRIPTTNQLKKIAKDYNFPFGYFFLNEIPTASETEIPFFRSIDDEEAIDDQNVKETVKILKNRQEWLSDYLKENGANKNHIIGIHKNESSHSVVIDTMRNYLELSKNWNLELKSTAEAIRLLTSILEEKNIIVTFNSIVNNNTHKHIPVKLCRGFCLIDSCTFYFCKQF